MPFSRRDFLRRSAAASAGLLIPGALQMLAARMSDAASSSAIRARGYGPLKRDSAGLLDLPEGFQYRALSTALAGREDDKRFTQRLSTGELVPARHDGMAAFSHGKDPAALDHLNRALLLIPTIPSARRLRACVRARMLDRSGAGSDWKAYLTMEPRAGGIEGAGAGDVGTRRAALSRGAVQS